MIPEKAIKPIIKNGRDNTEIAVGSLIAYGVFPQTQEGIQKAKDTIAANDNWLVPSLLPNYYDGIDSDLIVGRETAGIIFIRNALKEFYKLSAGTQDFVDTSVTKEETIASPKLPPAHYIQGQKARWEPEFENEIDHAVYFAGKSPLPKGAKQREVLDWLKSLGLTYKQIHDHREKVLEQMRETISVPGVEEEYPYVYIDAVDQDFVIEDDKEYDDEEDTEEYDYDLYGSNLDNLLGVINEDEKKDQDQDQKQVIENIEEEIVQASDDEDDEEGHIGSEDDIPDELLQDEVDPKLLEKLLVTINKPKKESSYTSNKKIFDSIVVNFGRLQSTLDTINNSLEKQNSLIKANIDTQLAIGELVSNQTELLGEKFDAILKEFQKQSDIAKDIADDEKRKAAEDSLEGQRDSAGTRDIDDLTKGGGKSKRGSKIADYYKQKALRRLYRAMPKRLRGGIRKVRKIKQTPSRIASRVTRGITNRMPSSVKRVASGASAIKSASKMTNLPGAKTGPLRTLFAGMEYGERKGSGQSELQALGGTGAGLAGGAAGGVGGAKIGAIAGTAIGAAIGFLFAGVGAAPGAAIGLKIGTVAGSLIGGWLGAEKASELADKVTGVHETGGLTKPGTALLHGTEAVINPNAMSQSSLISDVGGMFIGATTGYLNAVGPMAAPVAPVLKGISAQMAKQYDVPSTLTQTNVGGSLPNLSGELKKVKEKRKQTTGEELSGIEKDLLETQDPQSFADKLMKMLDPEGKFQQLLRQLNNPNSMNPDNYTGTGVDGDLKGNIVNPMEGGVMEDYPGAKFGADRPGRPGGHMGRDVVGPAGMKFVAALPGKVTQIIEVAKLPKGGWSKGVYIKHDNGIETRYLHVNPTVKVGDSVKAGQNLGSITEKDAISTVPHLHFEVLVNGVHRDPEPMIKGSFKLADIGAGKVPGLSIESHSGTSPDGTPGAAPTGDFDVIIPLDHVKPGNENKIPDKKGGNTFENARATGAAGRERDHQDKAAAKVRAKLEAKGLRVKVITPEDFGNYEDYDKYIKAQASKNVRIVPLHFDAAVGQGGTGFLTRTKKGDSGDAALAKPIQQKLSSFQKANPELGNLGPTDTVSNATINRASASPAALVEMGSMVAWEKQHGSNFTSTNKFDELATGIADGVYQGGGFNNRIKPPTQQPRFQSLQGKDGNDDTKYLIVNQQAKPQITGQGSQSASSFVSIGDGKWRSENEMSTTIRNLYMQRLGQ